MYFYLTIAGVILFLWLVRKFCNGPLCSKKTPLDWKTVIVTGSSAGIGKETAFDLIAQGATVIFACRDEKKTRAVINTLKDPKHRDSAIFMRLDLSSLDSIVSFVKEFKKNYEELDILINNAGVLNDTFLLQEGIEGTLMSNHIGHKILTLLLLDKFNKEEARIINLSSITHNISDYTIEELQRLQQNLDFEGEASNYNVKRSFIQYGNTKLANIYFTQYLAEKLATSHPSIKVSANHPGIVNTEINRFISNYHFILKPIMYLLHPFFWLFSKTSYVGAQTTLEYCYEDFQKLESGVYMQDCKKHKTSSKARDEKLKEEFMKYSWMLVDKVTHGKTTTQETIKSIMS